MAEETSGARAIASPGAMAGVSERASTFSEFRKGGPPLVAAALGSSLGLAGLTVYTFPFFMGPLGAEFGWGRSSIGIATTFLTLTLFLAGPWAGRLCDRLGVRRVIPVSIVLFACGLASLSMLQESIWSLYLGYAMVALLGSATSFVCYSRAITTWFDERRGLALGIAASGPGIAAASVPLLLPPIIAEYGWRGGYLALGGAALFALPLVLLLLRERPPVQAPSGSTVKSGLTTREALRTRVFWQMGIGTFLIACGVVGTHIHLVPMITDLTGSVQTAQMAAATYGMSLMVGRLLTGLLLDRFFAPLVAGALFLIPATGLIVMFFHGEGVTLIFAASLGLAAGAESDVISYLASRYFGLKAYSELFGWMYGAMALGVAAGPVVTGALYNIDSNYGIALLNSAALCVIGALLFATLGTYGKTQLAAAKS